jgi:hypothetical protein
MTNQFAPNSSHNILKDKLNFLIYQVVQDQHFDYSRSDGKEYQKQRDKRMDAVMWMLDSANSLFGADSSCDMSSAAFSLQEAVKLYPVLMEDPGYDENGSL